MDPTNRLRRLAASRIEPRIGRRRFLAQTGLAGGAMLVGPRLGSGGQRRQTAAAPASLDYPNGPFGTSTASLTHRLNEYWAIYGTAQGTPETQGALAAGALSAMGLNPAWDEWDAMQFAWTAHRGHRDTLMKGLASSSHRVNGIAGATGAQPDGYLWSWSTVETWPDGNAFNQGLGSYHFDQLPRYIIAISQLANWTRDATFWRLMRPRAEAVMDQYLLRVLGGSRGVLTTVSEQPNGTVSDGTSQGRPGNYMDEMRAGHQDGWVNAAFYTALVAMADLEDLARDPARGDHYRALARTFPSHYTDVFWTTTNDRFSGWVDVTGAAHDYGLTFVNLEAVARGIASDVQAADVFAFLAEPAQPTSGVPKPACSYPASAHPGSTEVYQDVFAPRLDTVRLPDSAWDGWSDASCGRRPYGSGAQEGGSLLWLANYDTMARLHYLDADAAFGRLTTMLSRMEADSQRLTLWGGRHFDDFGESFVEVGTNYPFPESGISATPVLYGFLGLKAAPTGLQVAPRLPHSLLSASAAGISYSGTELTVSLTRAVTIQEQSDAMTSVPADRGTLASPTFGSDAAFNQVGILLGGPIQPSAAGQVSLAVQQEVDGRWHTILRRPKLTVIDQNWMIVDLPEQHGRHSYRILTTNATPNVSWYANTSGELTFRAIYAPQRQLELEAGKSGILQFKAVTAFGRLSLHTNSSRVTATLSRVSDNTPVHTIEQEFADIPPAGQIVMGFADQAPGEYRLDAHGADLVIEGAEQALYTLTSPELKLHTQIRGGETYLIPAP